MQLKQAEFARTCGISRARVGQLVASGRIVLTGKKIDTDNPANRSFLSAHSGKIFSPLSKAPTAAPPLEAKHPRDEGKGKKERPAPPSKPPAPSAAEILAAIDDGQAQADDLAAYDLTPQEIRVVMRKNYYDAQKSKNEAELKGRKIDEMNGRIVMRDDVTMVIESIAQEIQKNFLDCIRPQATLICQALGKPGFEKEVEDVLSVDNGRRIETVKKLAKELAAHKRIILGTAKDDKPEDEEEE
jgi:hypothetical protein